MSYLAILDDGLVCGIDMFLIAKKSCADSIHCY